MRQRRHPLSGALYEVGDDGLVHVTLDGEEGVFTPSGVYVRGTIRTADPNLCGWLGGPQLPPTLARSQRDMPAGADR
jgi:hypothetical protein